MRMFRLAVVYSFAALSWAQEPQAVAGDRFPYRRLDELLQGVDATASAQQFERRGIVRRLCPLQEVRCHEVRAEQLPEAVCEVIRRHDAAISTTDDMPKSEARIWTGPLLDGDRVYVARWRCCTWHEISILHADSKSGVVAAAHLDDFGTTDPWPGTPRLQQTDLDGDGQVELVLDVHHHNGTAEDWDARHFLQPQGRQLRSELTVRHAQWDLYTPAEAGNLFQAALAGTAMEVRVVTWYENPMLGPDFVPLGVTLLARKDLGVPFREVSRTAWLPGAECHLGTCEPSYDCLR